MSTSKHISLICCIAVILALLVTVLFMNGKKLGITPMVQEESSGEFTASDRDGAWDATRATVITLNGNTASVEGNGAYFADGKVRIVYAGSYVIRGELTDGSIVVDADGDDRISILLDGAKVTCSDLAAFRVERADKVILTLADGTENTFSSGTEYSEDAISDGIDGAIYSRDDLTINGSGSLTVRGEYRHGIVCNDDLVFCGGKISVEAAQDGIHANDSARFADMNLTINAGDDGVTVSNDEGTGYIYMESGSISIPACYEGLEAIYITVAGGELDIVPRDDGINANGRGSQLDISGGEIRIVNLTGRDADGLDSNGDIHITGGSLFISVSNDGGSCAIDYGSESGGTCRIDGGTVIACGSSSMMEAMSGDSAQCSLMYNFSPAAAAETTLILSAENGEKLVEQQIPAGFSSVVISAPEMTLGKTYTLTVGDTTQEITLSETATTIGGGMGMMGGHGGFGNRGGWGGMNQDGTQQMPENFDPQNMPQDFDPNNRGERPEMPEDFGPNSMGQPPEDFGGGMGQPPEGFGEGDFDPSQGGRPDRQQFNPEDGDRQGGFRGGPGGGPGGRGQMPQNDVTMTGDFDPTQRGGFDPSQMGEDFDPTQRGGFDPSQMGEDFDPTQRGSFDHSQMGEDFDTSQQGGFDHAQMKGNRGDFSPIEQTEQEPEPENLPLRIALTCASLAFLIFGLVFAILKKY